MNFLDVVIGFGLGLFVSPLLGLVWWQVREVKR